MASSISPAGKSKRNPAIRTRPLKGSAKVGVSADPARATANKTLSDAVVEEARRSGLLDGEKSRHVSFRVPPALLEAAKRETGITSASELGILALAMLAQPDPVVAIMRKNRGRLGKDHKLDI